MLVDNYVPAVPGARPQGENMMSFFDAPNNAIAGNRLSAMNFCGYRRPFIGDDGHPRVIVHNGRFTTEKGERKPIRESHRIVNLLNSGHRIPLWVWNATTLRKEDWIYLDTEIVKASREPLQAWEDLVGANSVGGFNAYGKLTMEYQAMSDPGEAVVDLDMMTAGRHDSPLFTLRSHPLPITHSDFWYPDRFLEVSGNSGEKLDSVSGEAAGRRVAESIEDQTIGNVTGVTYGTVASGNYAAHEGTSTLYGYTNFTYRATKNNVTVPTGANPQATVSDVLAAIQTLRTNKYYGPFVLYFSQAWAQFLANDYAFTNGSNWATNPSQTLMDRLKAIPEIQDVRVLNRWTAPALIGGGTGTYAFLLVQMTSNVAQGVNGQAITTLMWESLGGMRKNFKVWAIQVPRLKAEYNQKTGILHAATS